MVLGDRCEREKNKRFLMNWRGTFIYGVILFYSVLLIFVIEGADSSVRVLFVTEQISFRLNKKKYTK